MTQVVRQPLGIAPTWVAGPMLVTLVACWLFALANVVLVTAQWKFDDIHAYQLAADRLVHGKPLYTLAGSASELYRYAPWFAIVWIPFLGFPELAVEVAWAAILLAATAASLWPFRRSWAGVALALLLGALLYRTAGWGNAQPLIVAALIYGLPTRAGPWVVGMTASLKGWPLLAAGVYAYRRDWRGAIISVGTFAVLTVPILLFDLSQYPAASRPPNIYDATFLLAVPALLNAGRRSGRSPAPRGGSPPRTRAVGAG